MGCGMIQPGEVLGVSDTPLVRIPITVFDGLTPDSDLGDQDSTAPPQDQSCGTLVGNVRIAEAPEPEPPPAELLGRLDEKQRDAFVEVWDRLPSHLRTINFDLVGSDWSPEVIRQLGDVLVQYEGGFSKSKTDLGHGHTLPFRIEVPPGTAPIASRPFRTNPDISR